MERIFFVYCKRNEHYFYSTSAVPKGYYQRMGQPDDLIEDDTIERNWKNTTATIPYSSSDPIQQDSKSKLLYFMVFTNRFPKFLIHMFSFVVRVNIDNFYSAKKGKKTSGVKKICRQQGENVRI